MSELKGLLIKLHPAKSASKEERIITIVGEFLEFIWSFIDISSQNINYMSDALTEIYYGKHKRKSSQRSHDKLRSIEESMKMFDNKKEMDNLENMRQDA